MSAQARKPAPLRAVVTPMRVSRNEDNVGQEATPSTSTSETDLGASRLPESVSLWPAVNLDVCRSFGLRHHPLPSAQAVLDRLNSPETVLVQPPGLVTEVEEFLKLVEDGDKFNCDCGREYLTRITGSGNMADAVLNGLVGEVQRIRGLGTKYPRHKHRCNLMEEFLQQCALMFQRAQKDELQTHAFQNIFTALTAVASLKFWNGADCFRHTQLLNTHVVSIPTLRAYLPLGGSSEKWSDPKVVAIAEVTRDPSDPHQKSSGLSLCLTQLVGELLAEQHASAFSDKTVGFAVQGSKVQLTLLKMDSGQRDILNTSRLTVAPAVIFTSPALDMCLANDRRMLLAVMAQLGLHGRS